MLRYKRYSCGGYSSSVCSFFVLLFQFNYFWIGCRVRMIIAPHFWIYSVTYLYSYSVTISYIYSAVPTSSSPYTISFYLLYFLFYSTLTYYLYLFYLNSFCCRKFHSLVWISRKYSFFFVICWGLNLVRRRGETPARAAFPAGLALAPRAIPNRDELRWLGSTDAQTLDCENGEFQIRLSF